MAGLVNVLHYGGIPVACGLLATAGLTSKRRAARFGAAALAAAFGSAMTLALAQGWFGALGLLASLGHGALDIDGAALIGLVGGGTALGFNALTPRPPGAISAPQTHSALFALFDGVILLIGLMAGAVALTGLREPGLPSAQASGMILTVISACACALLYGGYTTGHPAAGMVSRAGVAALFASSGGALLDAPAAVLLGALSAFCALPLAYWLQQHLALEDRAGVLGAALLPAALGALATGLLANGDYLRGWGGVGLDLYLNQPGLGVAGWLNHGDIGQLTAQALFAMISAGLPCASAFAFASVCNKYARSQHAAVNTAIMSGVHARLHTKHNRPR